MRNHSVSRKSAPDFSALAGGPQVPLPAAPLIGWRLLRPEVGRRQLLVADFQLAGRPARRLCACGGQVCALAGCKGREIIISRLRN